MDNNKSYCAECINFNDSNCQCRHLEGKLYGVKLNEDLKYAIHDCIKFDERRYKLSPPKLMQIALKVYDDVSFEDAKNIYKEFMALMIEHGYIEESDNDNQPT